MSKYDDDEIECLDAPCCGCCGRSLYGDENDPYDYAASAEPRPDDRKVLTMYDISFNTKGGSTTNSAHTFEQAIKEAARILTDQTDQHWTWWEADAQVVGTGLRLDGMGRINGSFDPEPWRITITEWSN